MDFTDPTARDASERTYTPADPDLEAIRLGEDDGDYDDLDDELAQLDDLTTVIEVPKRPGYAIRCRTDYTGREIDLIRKRARDKRFADGIDGVKFASLLLGVMCVAVLRHGEDLELAGESPVTFASKALQEKLGTSSVDDTVRRFYGLEGHVDSAGRRLMFEAGYGEEVYASDPTA